MKLNRCTTLLFLAVTWASCTPEIQHSELYDITIYRDQWGVPHIHAPTDEQVAYGLAWAECEDDFKTIQEQMLAIQGRLGELKGKDGLVLDFAIKFMGIKEKVIAEYDQIDPKTRKILEHFTDGVNAYAALHPEEVMILDAFPTTPQTTAAGGLLGLVEITGAREDLEKIMNANITNDEEANFPKGSNAFAVSSSRSSNGETFLAINSHQPLEGWYSWYEAHLISDEGQNILGGTFPGGSSIFHGTNEYLGWAHTVNHADFSDVYKLTMSETDDQSYLVDGQYKKLKKKTYKSWMKLWGPILIPISRDVYESDFGITFKTDSGIYAWRYVALDALGSMRGWYKLNRAKSLDDFKAALNTLDIPCTNIVYADNQDNIFYISNGKIPKRESNYDWRQVLPGDNSKLQWDEGYWPLDSLPQVLNPVSGYVFNTNNSPFVSSDSLSNPKFENRHKTMGFFPPELNNNRSSRLNTLLEADTSISYEEFKTIKFDRQYPEQFHQPIMVNQELLLRLDPNEFPEIKDAIYVIQKWNRRTDPDNTEAFLFLKAADILYQQLRSDDLYTRGNEITKEQCADAITKAKSWMIDNHGSIEVPLGDIQRHIRGDVDFPIGGGADVLAAIYAAPLEDGRYKARSGESYIQMVRFKKGELPIIESVHAYGSSADLNSPHSTDQMEMFVKQEMKPMSLSLEDVKAQAVRQYHPLKIEGKAFHK